MDRTKALKNIQALALRVWDRYTEIYPKLVKFDCPEIRFNARFSLTAGVYYWGQHIEISLKHLIVYPDLIINNTMAHELAHTADYYLNGQNVEKIMKIAGGHGPDWCAIMDDYGIPPNRYHSCPKITKTLKELIK